jgi:RNA polymerase sigma-70 factor, ECF subfamily
VDSETAADRELVAAFLRERDEASFRALYRRHTPAMYRLVLRMGGGAGSEAEDVIQEAWIRATTRLPGFRWDSSLRTWLSGIAVNCCRERWRTLRRDGGELLGPEAPRPGAPGSDGDRIDLERIIAALPAGYRAVLVLHDVEGYTHKEIGALLEIEEGTSKSQLFQARRAVRERLAAGGRRQEGGRP